MFTERQAHARGFPGSSPLVTGWGPDPLAPHAAPHRPTAILRLPRAHWRYNFDRGLWTLVTSRTRPSSPFLAAIPAYPSRKTKQYSPQLLGHGISRGSGLSWRLSHWRGQRQGPSILS
jgi:hypothetical protein